MPACPICTTPTDRKHCDTPYFVCGACGLFFQSPLPPKMYLGPDKTIEYDQDEMPERDKEINRKLARWMFDNLLKGEPRTTLDIGAKHPVLARALLDMGCDAHACEPVPALDDLGVTMHRVDFETDAWPGLATYRLITLVHVLEHFESPMKVITRLRAMMDGPEARMFVRIPDSTVAGIEREFTAHHAAIHPYIYSPSALTELFVRMNGDCFVIEDTYPLTGAGQRDYVIRPC